MDPRRLKEAMAILRYCNISKPLKRLIPRRRLRNLSLPQVPCYIDKDHRLHLIRVNSVGGPDGSIDLNAVLAWLQSYVQNRRFAVWAHFANRGRFGLVYLMDDAAQAEELERWLQRRPLLSPLLRPAVQIPVNIEFIPTRKRGS